MATDVAPADVQFDCAKPSSPWSTGSGHHSSGGRLMDARRAREWSWDGSARARWPNKFSRFAVIGLAEVTGGWLVLRLPSSLVTWATYWNPKNAAKAPLVKCIEASAGD